MGQRGRLGLGALGVAALVLGTAVVGGHQPHPGGQVTGAGTTPPSRLQLLLDQYSFSAQPAAFSLRLSVVNYGPEPISVLAVHLPQAGAAPVPGPGGDLPFTRAILLLPDMSAPLVVPVTVVCPQVLTAPLADHVDIIVGRGGGHLDTVHLSLAPLSTLLDEARHAACGVASASASVYPSYLARSVRAVRRDVVTATLRLADVGDAPATVAVVGTAPASVTVSPLRREVDLRPGQSSDLVLTWQVLSCAAAKTVRWPSVQLAITVPTSSATNSYGLDDTFGAAWRLALSQACS